MKKILIAKRIIGRLRKRNSFLNRADIKVLAAGSLNELLEIHRTVHADLVIADYDLPGLKTDTLTDRVRQQTGLSGIPIILICPDRTAARLKSAHFGADVVLFEPVKARKILAAARKLLNLSWRETYRVLLSVAVEGSACDQSFSCRTLDISTTGMLLETGQHFKAGDRVVCSFLLPDATRIGASAEVVRELHQPAITDKNLYGLRFLTLSPGAQEALDSLIRAMSPNAHAAPA